MLYAKVRQKFQDGSFGKAFYVYEAIREPYGKVWQNFQGGFCLKECVEVLETVLFTGSVDQFCELYRRDIYAHLIKEDSSYGWLSPFCEWYPCKYTQHQEVAEDYLGYNEEELEERGWIKVFKEYDSDKAVYAQINANERQLEWLYNHKVHYSKFACYQ